MVRMDLSLINTGWQNQRNESERQVYLEGRGRIFQADGKDLHFSQCWMNCHDFCPNIPASAVGLDLDPEGKV